MRRTCLLLILTLLPAGCALDGPAPAPFPAPLDGGPFFTPDSGPELDAGWACTIPTQATDCWLGGDAGYQVCNLEECLACVGDVGFGTNCNWGDACQGGACHALGLGGCTAALAAPAFNASALPPLITQLDARAIPASDPADCPDGGPRLEVYVDFRVAEGLPRPDGGSERLHLLLPGGAPGSFDYARDLPNQGNSADRTLLGGLCGRVSLNGGAVYLLDEAGHASNAACLPKL